MLSNILPAALLHKLVTSCAAKWLDRSMYCRTSAFFGKAGMTQQPGSASRHKRDSAAASKHLLKAHLLSSLEPQRLGQLDRQVSIWGQDVQELLLAVGDLGLAPARSGGSVARAGGAPRGITGLGWLHWGHLGAKVLQVVLARPGLSWSSCSASLSCTPAPACRASGIGDGGRSKAGPVWVLCWCRRTRQG